MRSVARLGNSDFNVIVSQTRLLARQSPDMGKNVAMAANDESKATVIANAIGLSLDKEADEALARQSAMLHLEPKNPAKLPLVHGHVLGYLRDGYAICIGGIVAHLPNRAPHFVAQSEFHTGDLATMHPFYIYDIKMDMHTGRYLIQVTMDPDALSGKNSEVQSNDADKTDISSILAGLAETQKTATERVAQDNEARAKNVDVMDTLDALIDSLQASFGSD